MRGLGLGEDWGYARTEVMRGWSYARTGVMRGLGYARTGFR
jgi:hypothetical protein